MNVEEEKRVVTVDELPDDLLKMPPPYWRGGGIFHLGYVLLELEDLLQQLLAVHTQTETKLEEYYEKYPDLPTRAHMR